MDILAAILAECNLSLVGLIIICIAAGVAGFVDSIAGGGGFITFPAYLFLGLPIHQTIATNKVSSCMGTLIATIKYIRNGYVIWKICLRAMLLAVLGSVLGSELSTMADENLIRILMLAAIPPAAYYVIVNKDLNESKEDFSKRKTLVICCIIALFMGFYDGFYGPGTGTFLMLLLTGVARINVEHAAGTTKMINLTTNVCSLIVFLANGQGYIALGLIAGVFNIVGNYIGANLFTEKGSKIVRPLVLVVLFIFAVRIICELTGII